MSENILYVGMDTDKNHVDVGGGAVAGRRGSLLGEGCQRAGGARSGNQAPARRRSPAPDLLRSGAMRLRHLSAAQRQAERELSGGGAIVDAAPTRRAGEDEQARLSDF